MFSFSSTNCWLGSTNSEVFNSQQYTKGFEFCDEVPIVSTAEHGLRGSFIRISTSGEVRAYLVLSLSTRGRLLGIKHFRVSTAKPTLVLLEENNCWFKITAVGEKVNAAESLLVVSTEVNAN
ncbi:hypothetical protein Tco_0021437 [Tanacetum coccineum]